MDQSYIWMALQISSGVLPTFLRVMARFFALLESRSITLLGTFWLIFCLLVDRSMVGPCAFVLNISSNSSTFRSFKVGSRESEMPKNETGSGFGKLKEFYLQYPLIIDLIEDGAVDLVRFQGDPVEDGHAELCLDGLLDLNR